MCPQQEKIMLTIEELEKFEHLLKSGQIDDQFIYGDEKERGELLELLEKLMDVADIADEVATRLIFRGLGGAPSGSAGTKS